MVHERSEQKRRRVALHEGPGKNGLSFVRGGCPACMAAHRRCGAKEPLASAQKGLKGGVAGGHRRAV